MEDALNNGVAIKAPTHFVGIRFNNLGKAYFFSTDDSSLVIGDFVVVETIRGIELGNVAILPQEIVEYKSSLGLKPILRRAIEEDIKAYKANLLAADEAFRFTQAEVSRLELEMNLTSAEFTLDRAKIIISYLSEHRVDFRELLHSLAGKLHTRIELRQIGTRDKAKMIGGVGICGLPLCCSTFLNEFDGISINRAKNQMLALNIPKLSGHCGKLICCLKYEDELYTELKKDFPRLGLRFNYNGTQYRITSLNVLNRTVKIEGSGDVQFLDLSAIKDILAKDKSLITNNKKDEDSDDKVDEE